MSGSDLVADLRKRAEIRAKIDRGDGEVDRISAQLLQAADEIERLRDGAAIEAAITEQTATIIAENETLRSLPAATLAGFLHWMIHRDVTVMIGNGQGADALTKPMHAFLDVNGIPKDGPSRPKLKTPGRVQA